MKMTLQVKLLAGFIVVLIIFCAVVLFSYKTQLDNDDSANWVTHTNQVLDKADRTLLGLVNMETGLRGYQLSGEDNFLEPYRSGRDEYQASLTELMTLTADNPAQITRWQEVAKQAKAWETTWAEPGIKLREQVNNGSASMQEVVEYESSAGGKTYMDAIRAKVAEASQVEEILLLERAKTSEASSLLNYRVLIWGTVLTVILGLVIGFALARSISKAARQMAYVAEGVAKGELDRPITINSKDEIGDLANAFRQMNTYIQEIARTATRLAEGDLTANLTPQSDKDVLGNAFTRVIGYQKQMAEAANRLALGDVAVNVTPQSDKDILGNAFSRMINYQQQVVEAANSLAEGDLTTEITPQSDKDALGNAFSQMIANLRELIGKVAGSAKIVNSASAQLSVAAEQVGQASQQVTATIQQIALGTAQQTQGITAATGNVEQMARAADGIARGAQEQAQGVQRTSGLIGDMVLIVDQVGQITRTVAEASGKVTQAARNGVTAVQQTGQGMNTIHNRTASAAEKVKEMGARSKEIGRIIETIDDIADKTDMLALNAAVEAARAGEHGRGFAVVADQVRKLSEDSKIATRDIADLIERVQETVREAISAMDSTVSEVTAGTRLAADTSRSLEEILQAAEQAAAQAAQIAGSVAQLRQKSEGVVSSVETVSAIVEENTAVAEEMAAGSQEVMQAMEGVASIAEENSASVEEVSASAEEMAAQVEEVVASAQELAQLAEQLQSAVVQFRIDEAELVHLPQPVAPLAKVSPGAKLQPAHLTHSTRRGNSRSR